MSFYKKRRSFPKVFSLHKKSNFLPLILILLVFWSTNETCNFEIVIFLQISFWLFVKSLAFSNFEFDACTQVDLPHASYLQIDMLGDCRWSKVDKSWLEKRKYQFYWTYTFHYKTMNLAVGRVLKYSRHCFCKTVMTHPCKAFIEIKITLKFFFFKIFG